MSSRIYRCEFNIRILIKFCNTDHRNVLNKMMFGKFALMLKFDHSFHDQCKNESLLSQFVILCRLLCQGNSAIELLTQTQKSCLHQSNFQLSVESKPVLYWFVLVGSVIGQENSPYSLKQSDAELKPTTT